MPDRPKAISEAVSRRLEDQRQRDTKPEVELRRLLHARGLRYRIDVRPLPDFNRRADIVFTRQRVAVLVDGCFWHRCPEHFVMPKNNSAWWEAKINRNVERDRETTAKLESAGWTVVRVWEHEDLAAAAGRVVRAVAG